MTEQKQCARTQRLRATVPFFFSDSFSVAVPNKKYIIVKMKCSDKIEVSISGTSLGKSEGAGLHTAAHGLASNHTGMLG